MALTWENRNFEKGLLTINKPSSLTRNGYSVLPLKIESSYRVVSIDAKTCKILKHCNLNKKNFFLS
ncbi:hypothetical protein [Enterococcus sp. UD-01]|uniref:hypothetical protein n=1 Tax=Enterococcus sp. UD-01 TaxID=3373911 RepID=UPI003832D532